MPDRGVGRHRSGRRPAEDGRVDQTGALNVHHALGGLLGLVEQSHPELRLRVPDLVAGTLLPDKCISTASLPIPTFSGGLETGTRFSFIAAVGTLTACELPPNP